MLCCFAKSVFYFGLMVYHIADVYFDWKGYAKLDDKDAFSAIPNGSSVGDGFYLASCISGTVLSLAMLVSYCFYIYFHLSCMCTSAECRKDCDRRFLMLELVVSVGELLCKDDIQSILMFLIYDSGDGQKCVGTLTKVYAICSIIAHLKLLVCFATKLCGLGSGEKCDSGVKCVFCFFGCVGSSIFLVFTSLYFAEIQRQASTCGTAP